MKLGERIFELRKKTGASQEELSEFIGVSRQAVSKWESGQSIPDLDKVIAMSDYFGVTTDYILKGIQGEADNEDEKDAIIFALIATAFNLISLILALVLWKRYWCRTYWNDRGNLDISVWKICYKQV